MGDRNSIPAIEPGAATLGEALSSAPGATLPAGGPGALSEDS